MSKRNLFYLTSILFLSFFDTQGQNFTLKGVVVDSLSNQPLFYANIALSNAHDSSSVSATFADEQGCFELAGINQGDYLLQITHIGYEREITLLSAKGDRIEILLDTFFLASNNIRLDAVEISATRPIYMMDGEKMLYNVAEDPGIQTGTASDALQNAPEVEVDIEGNITLRGVSSVEIWINDKPSKLNAENLKTYIQQLPANTLDRIEVITNPSARYSSQGSGGIINLITKSNIKKNQFISFGTSVSSRPTVSPWISYVWANEKLSINLYAYGYFMKRKSNTYSWDIAYNDNLDTSSYNSNTGFSENLHFSGGLYFNGTYTFDTMNTLSFWLNGNGYYSDRSSSSERFQKEYLSEVGEYHYETDQKSASSNGGGNVGVWYQHKFNNKGHNFSIDIDGSYSRSKSNSQYDRIYSDWLNKDKHQKTDNNDQDVGASLSFDYNIPYTKNGEIGIGVSGEYSQTKEVKRTDTLLLEIENIYVLDSLRYKDNNRITGDFSAYITIQQKFGNFTAKGGLRLETKNYNDVYLNSPKDNLIKNYAGLFPSLHLSYRTKSMHNFTASYTRRVNFPSASQLSTFINYSLDSYSLGNPDLLPTFTNSVEAGWTKFFNKFGSLGLSAYYRNSKDQISSLTDVNYLDYYGRIVSFTMPVNSGNSYQYGGNVNVMYRLKSFINIRLNSSIYHSYSQTIFREEDVPVETEGTTFSIRLNFWAKIWKVLEVYASGNYRSKAVSLFNETKPTYSINAGLRADFLQRKISVFLNVQDIFNWNKRENNITNPYYESYSSVKHNSRYISAGITFRFGKIEMEQQARTGGQME